MYNSDKDRVAISATFYLFSEPNCEVTGDHGFTFARTLY